MARVVLVSFAGYPYTPSSLMPDNGLANLAGVLRATGHEGRVLDYGTTETLGRLYPRSVHRRMAPLVRTMLAGGKAGLRGAMTAWRCDRTLRRHAKGVYREIAREILEHVDELGAGAVGFKLWNGDGFLGTVRIARAIRRERPELRLFAGGPHVDWFHAEIFRHTRVFDCLAWGEGEPAIAALADFVDGRGTLDDVPNLLYLDRGRIRRTRRHSVDRLDELPLPAYDADVYASLHSGRQIRLVTLDESRGCPGRCAFCLHGTKSGCGWRFKSPVRILEEIAHLRRTVRTRCFVYAGSNTPARAACDNARAILDAGLDVRYACFAHVKAMGNADFDLLARSGCQAIFIGLESASPRILRDAMNKNLPLDRAETMLADLRRADIASIVSVIHPAPFEDDASRAQTLEFLVRTRPDSVPVQFPGLIPGTRWQRKAKRYGFAFPRGRAHARRVGLTYKIKLLFPPKLWPKLPYTLGGQTSRDLVERTGGFIRDLESHGLTTGLGHDLTLMARELGMDVRTFRDECREIFLTGDVDRAEQMVADLNRAFARPATVGRDRAQPVAVA